MLNIPNLLSIFRMVIVPLLLYFAWTNEPTLFLVFYTLALLSDFADGFIARRLNQVSELGAKLDTWGDYAISLSVPICAWWLWPELIIREAPFVILVVISCLVPAMFGFCKYGRLTSYHTWGAKLSAVLMGATTLLLFAGGPAWPFRSSTIILFLAGFEEIAITTILPEWRADVSSFFHARKTSKRKKR